MEQIEVRDYQQRIITKTVAEFTEYRTKSVLLVSPTGSGKTVMALSALKKLEEINPATKFVWVAMRRNLLRQAQRENDRFIGVKNIQFVSMFDSEPPKGDLVIFDECQHAAAATFQWLLDQTGAKFNLGMTATPQRTDKVKIPYEKCVDDCGVRFLIEKGYLCNFTQYVIPKWTPQSVADRFLAEPERWGKSIVYFTTGPLCEEFNALLQAKGIKSEIISGGDPFSRRDELLTRFEEGDLQVLVNIYLLTEGFDSPSLQTAWVRDSGKLCTTQMAGRVLRKDPANPSKVANIVQSEETWFPYTKVTKAFSEFVWQQGRWMSLTPGPQVEQVSNLVRERLFAIPVRLPEYLNGRGFNIRVTSKGKVSKAERKKNVRRQVARDGFDDMPL